MKSNIAVLTIYTERIIYEGRIRIKLIFPNDHKLIYTFKIMPQFLWSPTLQCWHIQDITNHIKYLDITFNGKYNFIHNHTKIDYINPVGIIIYYQQVTSEERIYLRFVYDPGIIDLIKKLESPRWHRDRKLWSIKGAEKNLKIFIALTRKKQIIIKESSNLILHVPKSSEIQHSNSTDAPVHKLHHRIPQKLLKYMSLKNYSQKTIKAYSHHISCFLNNWDKSKINEGNMEQINEYIYNHVTQGKYSRSYQNQLINAIKLYYKVMHDKNLENNTLPRPKNEKKLPVILSRNEIKSLIKVTLNLKHRTILILIYGTGIRLSESVNIHIKDLDFNRNLIHIHGGKGKKDRIVPFSGILQNHIKQYLESYQPKTYLFEGIKYKKYSCRSVQNILVHDKNFLTN